MHAQARSLASCTQPSSELDLTCCLAVVLIVRVFVVQVLAETPVHCIARETHAGVKKGREGEVCWMRESRDAALPSLLTANLLFLADLTSSST